MLKWILVISCVGLSLSAQAANDIGFTKRVDTNEYERSLLEHIDQNTGNALARQDLLVKEMAKLSVSLEKIDISSQNTQRILERQAQLLKNQVDILKEQRDLLTLMTKYMARQQQLMQQQMELKP